MYDRDWCLIVEVVHSHGNLLCPDQDLVEINRVLSQVVIESAELSKFFNTKQKRIHNAM